MRGTVRRMVRVLVKELLRPMVRRRERIACGLENDVWEDVEVQERRDKSTQEANGYEIDYFESDDHGSIVESSSEEKHEHGARRRKKFLVYNPNHENPKLYLRMPFRDGETFKDVIRNYSKVSRRELKIVTNEPKRIRVKCITFAKCPWRYLQVTIRDQSVYRRAKKRVNKRLAKSFKEEFAMLWDYADELRVKNPDSTIKMAMHTVTLDSPPYFKRFYVCFDCLKKGWKVGCRSILGLDGCFLKGHFKSEMLTVVGRDVKNQMYLVAWAIVEGECIDSWAWFLNVLAIDLDLEDGFGYAIISDKQKGLDIAIDEVLPRIEHKNYARHVFANWSGRKKAKFYEFYFWEIVKATTEREWEDKVENLKKKDEKVANELMSKSPKHWAKAIFPINGTHEWVKFGIEPILPAIDKKMPGRPKKNRRNPKDELKKKRPGQLRRVGLIITCNVCEIEAHNKQRCR
ncbi:hypothetical protein PVK06_008125 [Gossypium arboreum]|uniref:MULE transposase domain-containing protein n=1 Tax=Gossypium arboreum TaxID=29729 RepID=A0ABR0QKD9_GOSAR|nr:hypothetical protein PVK06_008125 [Gossypium arboreum]